MSLSVASRIHVDGTRSWLFDEGDGRWTLGLTDLAAQSLEDLLSVELPSPGKRMRRGESCAVLESPKAIRDLLMPIAGLVIQINEKVFDRPRLVMDDPFGQGWLFRIDAVDLQELEVLSTVTAIGDAIRLRAASRISSARLAGQASDDAHGEASASGSTT